MGHIARDCPEPERTCYVCNKSGHISRQCTENKSENRNAKVIIILFFQYYALPQIFYSSRNLHQGDRVINKILNIVDCTVSMEKLWLGTES